MQTFKSIFSIIITITISCRIVNSQQVVSNMGASLQNSSGSISFTLGEPVIATLSASDGIVTQGFHQTKLTVTAIEENLGSPMSVKVFPNPTTNVLYVSLDCDEIRHIKLVLYDISGKILTAINADKDFMEVDFSGYLPGTYIIKIYKGRMTLGAYKIVKIE